MFVADMDLSWSDGRTETVGQRRARKTRDSISGRNSSFLSSRKSDKSFEFRPVSRKTPKQSTSLNNLREVAGPPKTATLPRKVNYDIDSQKVLRTPGLFARAPIPFEKDLPRTPKKTDDTPKFPGYSWLQSSKNSFTSSHKRSSTVSSARSHESGEPVLDIQQIDEPENPAPSLQQISLQSFGSRTTTTTNSSEVRTSHSLESLSTRGTSPRSPADSHQELDKLSSYNETKTLEPAAPYPTVSLSKRGNLRSPPRCMSPDPINTSVGNFSKDIVPRHVTMMSPLPESPVSPPPIDTGAHEARTLPDSPVSPPPISIGRKLTTRFTAPVSPTSPPSKMSSGLRNILQSLPPLEPPSAPAEPWKAPSDWDCPERTVQRVQYKPLTPLQSPIVSAPAPQSFDNNSEGMTHFQRFIRRMESAGPKIILDRLNEDWAPEDPEERESAIFEKQLWILTALQLRKLNHAGPSCPIPEADLLHKSNVAKGQQKRILELYGNLAEVYQLSAMNPHDQLRYLSTSPQGSVPLPSNVSYLTVPIPGITPFPYPSASFDRIRASNLPSRISLTKLPSVLQECHRLLAPDGILEMRILSPSPEKDSMGPKLRDWVDDNLLLNLEQTFRCLRPAVLLPKWIEGAGLTVISPSQSLRLPAVHNPDASDVSDQLAALVAQALWLDVWGDDIQQQPGKPHVWWDIPELAAEAIAHGTIIECTTILAKKAT